MLCPSNFITTRLAALEVKMDRQEDLIEPMCQPPAIDVERFQDLQNGSDRQTPLQGPNNNIEVFLSGFETIENAIEKKGVVVELALQEAEVAPVELHPKTLALQVLQPAGSQVAPPVLLDPAANGILA